MKCVINNDEKWNEIKNLSITTVPCKIYNFRKQQIGILDETE